MVSQTSCLLRPQERQASWGDGGNLLVRRGLGLSFSLTNLYVSGHMWLLNTIPDRTGQSIVASTAERCAFLLVYTNLQNFTRGIKEIQQQKRTSKMRRKGC